MTRAGEQDLGLLLINPRSGDDDPSPFELRTEAEQRGIAVHVLLEGEKPGKVAGASGARKIGMAGGDGSLAEVAQVAIEQDVPFVCIPFGTRNHFARDLGLDRNDPIAALAAFGGDERRVDLGRVNDRPFLNNVSLGLYARLVHRREQHRRRRQTFARLRAYGIVPTRRRPVRLTLEGKALPGRIVLVANNSYVLDLFSIGERERLDEGCLHLYSTEGLVPGTWEDQKGSEFTIEASAPRIATAVDGEPVELETPLRFRVEPRSLRVLVPPGAAPA